MITRASYGLSLFILPLILLVEGLLTLTALAAEPPSSWTREWPKTDFTKSLIDFGEIISGGPPKDGIPAIDRPHFAGAKDVTNLDVQEPVIVFTQKEEAKAYPLQILIWHEIVNDTVGGLPVTVTYCPLCNTAIVFSRELDGRILDFGVSGKLHHSDMIMYDRQTESWWQQFTGEAIIGEMTGKSLKMLASTIWPFERFKKDFPQGRVLMPVENSMRPYGRNPYQYYDTSKRPFLFRGEFDEAIAPLAYVVAVDDQAWPLTLLRERGEISAPPLRLRWQAGMKSALDKERIAEGRDIGFVEVVDVSGAEESPVPFMTTFAFAFRAFRPDGTIHGISSE